jgi:hypothetical protein
MSLKQLSAGIMVGVFALSFISSELADASDKDKEGKRVEAKVESTVTKEKPRKEERPSLWETRQISPSGPKY